MKIIEFKLKQNNIEEYGEDQTLALMQRAVQFLHEPEDGAYPEDQLKVEPPRPKAKSDGMEPRKASKRGFS